MRYFSILLMCVACIASHAQTPNWDWAIAGMPTGVSSCAKIMVGKNGDIYVAGTFTNSFSIESSTVVSNGGKDAYIAKFTSTGHLLWIDAIGGNSNDEGAGLAEDNAGNIYFTGYYTDSAIQGGQTLLSNGAADIFIAKYNAQGKLTWIKHAGGTLQEKPGPSGGIAVDSKGCILLTGLFSSSNADFGGVVLHTTASASIFLIKYDSSGRAIWARKAGNPSFCMGVHIKCDGNDNYYVGGVYNSQSATFDSIRIVNGGTAINTGFLAKYDSAGTVKWVRTANAYKSSSLAAQISVEGIAVDNEGNSYVIGTNSDCYVVFGSLKIDAIGGSDIFIVKYDSAGNVGWAKGLGGGGRDYGSSVEVDKHLNVYLTGGFSAETVFGLDTFYANGVAAFVAKYSQDGDERWIVAADGLSDDLGSSVAIDAQDQVYVGGNFYSNKLLFGTNEVYSPVGDKNFFLTKLKNVSVGVEQRNSPAVLIYPNPAEDDVIVKQTSERLYDTYYIGDVAGRQWKSGELHNNDQAISIASLPAGVYYMVLRGRNIPTKYSPIIVRH